MVDQMTGMRPSAISTYIAVSGSPRSWENAQMMAAKAAPSLVTDRSTTPAADRKLLKRPIEWEVGAGDALGVMISCSMRAEIIRLGLKSKLRPLIPGTAAYCVKAGSCVKRRASRGDATFARLD